MNSTIYQIESLKDNGCWYPWVNEYDTMKEAKIAFAKARASGDMKKGCHRLVKITTTTTLKTILRYKS